ncbi:MAG TPA: leucine--tRNA ligase [Terriglobia bacterium]|nr:leucine--tRNA ligase [Terriglobia bacterium]
MSEESYNHREIEPKWREYWISNHLHEARDDDPRPKYYCLDMFPYPSGSGLHVGHWRSYVLPDCWSRYKRLQGFNVLHPMGWDAFGSPAENDAIQKGIHPTVGTQRNIENFKRQLHEIGAMYDWSREVNTTDPDYYKWTQWIFVKMFKAGLAYKTYMPVNWCPSCKTGIANEDVVNGRCERCGTEVTKRELNQWMLRITKYADRLLNGLESLDWPEKVKTMQTNWIGRSEGAEVTFTAIAPNGAEHPLKIFTTRPDTLFGATYMVMAPEHPLVEELTSPAQARDVQAYVEKVKHEKDIDRAANIEKTGVFTGAYAVNPVNGEKIPIWIADYVLMAYGTGAIMAVPAHDERDYEFAKKFGLEIREVISSKQGTDKEAFIGEGTMVNSGQFTGLASDEGRKAIVRWLESKGLGSATVNYKLRDWVFSRQRYWGEPIPIIHCSINCGLVPVPESDLPVRLPDVERYQPTGTGESPLAAIHDWVNVKCPNCGNPAERETDTMPQWAGSSWYFLRYASPRSKDALITEKGKEWLPVDLYVGGVEHAILHLLYARFYTMFLHDIGVVDFDEPFERLFNQGMITHVGKSGKAEKMSKSKGNVVNPDELVRHFGCDSLRMYELFVGPPELDAEWNDHGIEGVYRFLKRAWHWVSMHNGRWNASPSREMLVQRHLLTKNVTERLEAFRMNTIVSSFMEFINEVTDMNEAPDKETVETFLVAIAPFAPHFAEELWQRMGHQPSIFSQKWPKWDETYTTFDTVTVAVQVNGKVRGTIVVKAEATEESVVEAATNDPTITRYLDGKPIRKKIYVKNRILNLVVG